MLKNEGFREIVYFDTEGIPTIGKGLALVTRSSKKEFVPHKENLDLLAKSLGKTSEEYLALSQFANDVVETIQGTKSPTHLEEVKSYKRRKTPTTFLG